MPDERLPRLVDVISDQGNITYASFGIEGSAEPGTPLGRGREFFRSGHPPEPWWDVERVLAAAR